MDAGIAGDERHGDPRDRADGAGCDEDPVGRSDPDIGF